MVSASFKQKPGRKTLMKTYGADVYSIPSNITETGKKLLNAKPDHPGSLGIAISEAIEHSLEHFSSKYSLGSVLNFVLLHQTIIGQEVKTQLNKVGIAKPDMLIGSLGGGSNFGGLIIPFVIDKIIGQNPDLELIGVEPYACPSICKGEFLWDYGDTAKKAPIVKMHTLGHNFVPSPIHAGGLRYHGVSPIISALFNENLMNAAMHRQLDVLKAGVLFAKTEGILPAPETCHAIKETIHQALKANESGEEKTIIFNFSGHGYFDLTAYEQYLGGNLVNSELKFSEILKSLNSSDMPKVDESQF